MLALVLGLALGLAGGILGTGVADQVATSQGVGAPLTTGTFAKLAESVKPAVVNIKIEGKAGPRALPELFGEGPERMPRRGMGSGVIIDAAGVALTNAHVVEQASQVEVVMLDGTTYKAKVIGMDKKTDLAVLNLNASPGKRFPFLPLGDSDAAQVGDWVVAVGSPFGLQATVTSGIVSAKARQIGAGPYDDFLQTDAAINPGNSGGPLVNMRGEIIGINTAIVRGGSGIGFAIPSNMVKRIATELRANGSVTRGWLGVALQPLTPELAASFGVKDGRGALVSDVTAGSPAERAGVKPGDVVLEINGKTIANPGDLARVVGLARPGTEAKLKVWREGREHTLALSLAQMPGEAAASRTGVEVRPLTRELASELGIKRTDGVVVSRVAPGSAAAEAGIRQGDVIVEIDRQPVATPADFERLTRALKPEQPLTVRLQRGQSSLYIALTVERG
jgi:serine protease Do